MKGDGEDAH